MNIYTLLLWHQTERKGDSMFQKLFRFFERTVPLLIMFAVPLAPNVAADDLAKPAHIADAALPAPGTYQIDPIHSFAFFSAWHHIVGVVRGRFDKVTGTITVSPDPAACAVDVTIATYSISTQNTIRDDDLRGPDFFNVTQFPTMTYSGHGIRRLPEGAWIMEGSLTIRGISKVVPMRFGFKGMFRDMPAGAPARAAFHGTAATKRADFGMTRDNLMELGVPPAPGADVGIEIDIEANANAPSK
jgi:polyisoprenoid-binding protein YceI